MSSNKPHKPLIAQDIFILENVHIQKTVCVAWRPSMSLTLRNQIAGGPKVKTVGDALNIAFSRLTHNYSYVDFDKLLSSHGQRRADLIWNIYEHLKSFHHIKSFVNHSDYASDYWTAFQLNNEKHPKDVFKAIIPYLLELTGKNETDILLIEHSCFLNKHNVGRSSNIEEKIDTPTLWRLMDAEAQKKRFQKRLKQSNNDSEPISTSGSIKKRL